MEPTPSFYNRFSSTVGSVASSVTSTVGSLASSVTSTVGSVASGVTSTVGSVPSGVTSTVGSDRKSNGAIITDTVTNVIPPREFLYIIVDHVIYKILGFEKHQNMWTDQNVSNDIIEKIINHMLTSYHYISINDFFTNIQKCNNVIFIKTLLKPYNIDKQLNRSDQPNKYSRILNNLIKDHNTIKIGKLKDHIPLDLIVMKCQVLGGFKVKNFELLQEGNWGNPKSIFHRLSIIASENLIALTEVGDGIKYVNPNRSLIEQLITTFNKVNENNNFNYMNIKDTLLYYKPYMINTIVKPKMYAFDDTTFFFKDNIQDEVKVDNITNLKKKVIKAIKSKNLTIINIHLDSTGPKTTIEKFLEDELKYDFSEDCPDIIIGDTNITVSKCKSINLKKIPEKIHPDDIEIYESNIQRNNIIREIKESINKIYNTHDYSWGVIMNPIKIDKQRSYGFLLNQQISKSNKAEIESDGTIIAFRYPNNIKGTKEWDKLIKGDFFGNSWLLCIDENDHPNKIYESRPTLEPIEFLTFDTEPDKCLDTNNGMLMDRLFIDHPPVQFSGEGIKQIIGKKNDKGIVDNYKWKNLIALNLNSIINSGKKSWNVDLIECIDKIGIIDKELFIEFNEALTSSPSPPKISTNKVPTSNNRPSSNEVPSPKVTPPNRYLYDTFIGSEFGELEINRENFESISLALENADTKLNDFIINIDNNTRGVKYDIDFYIFDERNTEIIDKMYDIFINTNLVIDLNNSILISLLIAVFKQGTKIKKKINQQELFNVIEYIIEENESKDIREYPFFNVLNNQLELYITLKKKGMKKFSNTERNIHQYDLVTLNSKSKAIQNLSLLTEFHKIVPILKDPNVYKALTIVIDKFNFLLDKFHPSILKGGYKKIKSKKKRKQFLYKKISQKIKRKTKRKITKRIRKQYKY